MLFFPSTGLLSHGLRASESLRSCDQTRVSVDPAVTLSGMDVDWLRVDVVAVVQRHNNTPPPEPLFGVDESNQNMIKGEQLTSLHHLATEAVEVQASS